METRAPSHQLPRGAEDLVVAGATVEDPLVSGTAAYVGVTSIWTGRAVVSGSWMVGLAFIHAANEPDSPPEHRKKVRTG
jgi:hypothetical protein